MSVDGEKIKQLVKYYGQLHGYPEKSYLAKFCEDNSLNYNQWNAYTRNKQEIGIKIIHFLIDIFPDLNLNWFFKNEGEMNSDGKLMVFEEPQEELLKEISQIDIYKKLELIHYDLKKIKPIKHNSDTEK